MAMTDNTSQSRFPSDGEEGLDNNVHRVERAGTDLLQRAVQGAHATVDRLAETAAPHVQRLAQGVDSAAETLGARAEHARDVGDEWVDSLRSTVRDNPLAALLAAVVAGVVIARLTS